MTSESTTRSLLLAAGGLAAVGVVSLGLTFVASDSSDSSAGPAASTTTFATSSATTVQTTMAPTTMVPTTTRPTTTAPRPTATTIPALAEHQVMVTNGDQVGWFDPAAGRMVWALARQLPSNLELQIVGASAVLFDTRTGRLWLGPPDQLVAEGVTSTKETTKVDPESRIALTSGGDVIVVTAPTNPTGDTEPGQQADATADSVSTPTSDTVSAATTDSLPLSQEDSAVTKVVAPAQFSDDTMVTAVGDELVYLNPDGTLFGDGWSTKLNGSDFVLQQPGPDSDVGLVASSTGLFKVQLENQADAERVGEEIKDGGTPVRPVRTSSCIEAAWAGTGQAPARWYHSCADATDQTDELPDASSDDRFIFRVSGELVVLNASETGKVWVRNEPVENVDVDWSPAAAEVQS